MRWGPSLRFAVLASIALTSAAWADFLDSRLSLNFFLTEPSYSGVSDPIFDAIEENDCEELRSAPMSGPAFVWVVLGRDGGFGRRGRGEFGTGGLQFGLEHRGIEIEGWSLATGGSLIAMGPFPDSGTAAVLTWDDGCYEPPGEVARVGFFLVSESGRGEMRFTSDVAEGQEASFVPCLGRYIYDIPADNLGSIQFGLEVSPVCAGTSPVEETSWSSLKSLYH